MENQQKVIPMGRLQEVTIDIEGTSVLADFEVIKIMDDRNPYLVLLDIDWATDMNGIRHGIGEWDILCEGFIISFSFEDGFECIDEVLQEVKVAIFRIPQDTLDLIQPDWSTQLSHALECYNIIAKEEDEDLLKINIPKIEGHYEVEGPQIENPDITVPLKMKHVNIGTKAEPKFVKIGDYWDDVMFDNVTELLCEYQDLFPTKFTDLKGIIRDLGVMKITLKLNTKSVKQRLYRFNSKYKEKVRLELDKMLATGIIEPVEESDWISPMVVKEKKQKDKIRICIDLRKLNDACVHDPFPTPFTNEMLDNVGG
eukprot:PITA_04849